MKTLTTSYTLVTWLFLMWSFGPSAFLLANYKEIPNAKIKDSNTSQAMNKPSGKQIHLALLLDTSNSMDGLINQAKSQLWNIVDELADAESNGESAELFIALYEYGNDNLSVRSNYIRQISAFTQDLDEISTLLFALKTNGGSEYCGAVIGNALEKLNWSSGHENLRMIFIAGNEPFNQGGIDYKSVCKASADRDIQVNTIFCGNYNEGIKTRWLNGAQIGGGEYMNIDMDRQTVYVSTPYDSKIDQLNDDLNDTYIAYGEEGRMKKAQQLTEDNNAASYSQSNKVKRAISKSKHIYKNDNWDLVDARKEKNIEIASIPEEDLPEIMRGMSKEEKENYVEQKSQKRHELQQEIQELGELRGAYIKHVNDSLAINNELEEAILRSIKVTAQGKNFEFKD